MILFLMSFWDSKKGQEALVNTWLGLGLGVGLGVGGGVRGEGWRGKVRLAS